MNAVHCDRADCDTWTTHNPHHHGFLTVTAQDGQWHYCGWDCLLREAAKIPPPTVIEGAGQ